MLLKSIKRQIHSLGLAAAVAGMAGSPAFANPDFLLSLSVSADPAAVQSVLSADRKTDPAVRAFYAARGNAPFWLGDDVKWGKKLVHSLRTSHRHGLPVSRYNPDQLLAQAQSARTPQELARAELAFMRTYIQFGRDIGSGILEPRKLSANLHVFPVRPSPAALMTRLSGAPKENFDALAPATADYKGLMKELEVLSARAVVNVPLVPRGKTLRPGRVSSRVPALRARLDALEALTGGQTTDTVLGAANATPASTTSSNPNLYDPDLVERVRAFQTRGGLKADGIVGPQTLAAINATSSDRYGQILVNLERARWMNRNLGQRHIRVNLANFSMALVEGEQVRLTSRVVVGKSAKHQTPEFSDEMTHLVVNPTWHVPVSIATKEILPRLKADPNYARNRGMRLVPTGGHSVPDGVTSDFSQFSQGYFPFRIKQRPSRRNALGLVKFMFPNQFAIYLHDTPSKKLFNRETRAFSHGCVRVQRPFDLAHALLEGQYENPEATFNAWVKRGRERRVNLDRTVQVHLMYRTAWIDGEGNIQYRKDIYGRDRIVLRALNSAGVAKRV